MDSDDEKNGEDDDASGVRKNPRVEDRKPNGSDDEYDKIVFTTSDDNVQSSEKQDALEQSDLYPSQLNLDGDTYFGYGSQNDGPSMVRRLSRGVSEEWERRRRSSLKEQLPQTTHGWAIFLSTISAMILRYELKLQKSLTCPPHVHGQVKEGPLKEIHEYLTKTDSSILRRDIQPSLFFGTRGAIASTVAYLLGGPADSDRHLRFREFMKMPSDGAIIAVEWELPFEDNPATNDERKQEILRGKIRQPVVLILHGMNNHADFGYVRSLMRMCAKRGWVAAGMNLRGSGGVNLATPRGYNAAYTGDVRSVVNFIEGRLDESGSIFLVGNSLGANMIAKYLGEEGLSGSLPKAVAGGITLGNPLSINSHEAKFPWSPILALGAKKSLLENISTLKHVNDPSTLRAFRNAMTAFTLAQFDEALAPVLAHNDAHYPFNIRPGYPNGAVDYWRDAGSYKVVPYIPVPFLTIAAKDDMIVYNPARKRMSVCLLNPNVMWVETMCGGHLGWQEAPPEKGNWGFHSSWADSATADFIEATLQARERHRKMRRPGMKDRTEFHSNVGNTIQIKGNKGFAEHPLPLSRL